MKVTVVVRLRSGVLDVQGEAVRGALRGLGLGVIDQARVGKVIELHLDTPDPEQARALADEACRRLLVNPVLEEYTLEVAGGG